MTTITILKKLIKEKELVIIPRREYEKLLEKQAVKRKIKIQRSTSFHVPKKQEPFYNKLDEELTEILKECEEGKISEPFTTIKEGKKFLANRKSIRKTF